MSEVTFRNDVTATLVKTNASDDDVYHAARVSVVGGDRDDNPSHERLVGLIGFLWRNQHTSPFEHGSFTFLIHCPIFVAREFMRHRTFSFNEESGRYSVLKPEFYIPGPERNLVQLGKPGAYVFSPGTRLQHRLVERLMKIATRSAYRIYEYLLKRGVAKEVSRMILPLNIYTSFYATVNPRNLIHFLNLRTAHDAQYEIQLVARQMEEEFKKAMPLTYRAWDKDR